VIRVPPLGLSLLLLITCLGGIACELKRPPTVPVRMLEPQLLEPQMAGPEQQVIKSPDASPVRLVDSEALAHIGRRLLHQQPDGELTEDSVWRWSSPPGRYLDTALRLEVAASRGLRLVDSGRAPGLAAKLLVWELDSTGSSRLVGAVEFQITGTDRVVQTQVVRASEPFSGEQPGGLAPAAGRLVRHLPSQGLQLVPHEQSGGK